MRAERLPDSMSQPTADDGLGGYQDTEALGVVHPPVRSASVFAEPVRAPADAYEVLVTYASRLSVG